MIRISPRVGHRTAYKNHHLTKFITDLRSAAAIIPLLKKQEPDLRTIWVHPDAYYKIRTEWEKIWGNQPPYRTIHLSGVYIHRKT